ncbi:hypothetical protein HPB52_022161 [Rhipicephalus sanguineus]|uniref:Secreted protein n=1 Tax=Rhipicephalus sanguineus TaxID=34632 RepID=A0A9D4T6C9_RHISA|nr:hypothetical protein HPB52_022161 [Rhipicephalus sanguineus]
MAGMRLVNPFIYLVQLFAALSTSSAVHNGSGARTHPASTKLIDDIDWHEAKVPFNAVIPTLPRMRLPSPITSENDHGATTMTQWTHKAIRMAHDPRTAHGHGSMAGMSLVNPFIYLVQVRKSYGKCFRTS